MLALFFLSCTGKSQIPYSGQCARAPKLELVSLALVPDPLPEARKIGQWRAIIRSDNSDVCRTLLAIVEVDTEKSVTPEQNSDLSLGANEITLYSLDDYRLAGKEVCFGMIAFIGGEKLPVDSPKRFCARTIDRGWWSMR
jgi:hypothetical protein